MGGALSFSKLGLLGMFPVGMRANIKMAHRNVSAIIRHACTRTHLPTVIGDWETRACKCAPLCVCVLAVAAISCQRSCRFFFTVCFGAGCALFGAIMREI